MTQNLDEERVQEAIRKLEPFAKTGDIEGFRRTVQELKEAWQGLDELAAATSRLSTIYPKLFDKLREGMGEFERFEFNCQVFDIVASILESAGLRLEEHFRTANGLVFYTHSAIDALKAVGFDAKDWEDWAVDSLAHSGFTRIGGFVHPLSRAKAGKDSKSVEAINLWASISGIVSIAQGWFPPERLDDQQRCMDKLRDWVIRASPELDLDVLMRRSRYSDENLLFLCSLAFQGLTGKVAHQRSEDGHD